jgi:type I restriction enzyme S subunit
MAGEATVQLRNVCVKIGSGATPRGGKEAYKGGSTSLIRSQNIYNEGFHREGLVYIDEDQSAELRNVEVKPNDVLLNITGDSVARCCQVAPDVLPARVNQHVAIIRPQPNSLDARFLRYVLVSHQYQSRLLALASAGATRPALTKSMIEELHIPSPPLAEQKAIAAVLGALDDKIELNRRMNATLQAMARALFHSWFVDFDPVRAKLDGRKPIGLDDATAALFPASFAETELGILPHGWQVKTIDELAERVAMGPFGSDIKVSTFVPEGIPVVSGQHLRGTLLEDSEFNFVTVEHADRLKRSNVQRGDVIFTHAGSIGQVAYIPEASRYERYIVSQRQFYMRCNRAVVSPFYITSYFKTPEGQHRLLANTSSTGVPSISQPVTYLRQLKMVVPPPALLKVFDATVSEIHLKMADNDHQSRTLATIRDTLLPKLLSGELIVADCIAEVIK